VRVTTAFKRLMDLPGVTVADVDFQPARVVVTVKLSSRKLHCTECGFTTKARYDTRPVFSSWRHLDLGRWRLEVRANLRRINCPVHGVRTESVPFARSGSRFTRDFEDLAAWLATSTDKTALCRLVRIDWDTTGRIIERVMATGLDPKRLDNLFVCGADEVSWRKGHSYLTLVSNNDTGKFVWGKEGKDTATLDCFFAELGEERSAAITAMSMDMGPAFEKSARKPGHATKAVICFDPFHVVQAGTQASVLLYSAKENLVSMPVLCELRGRHSANGSGEAPAIAGRRPKAQRRKSGGHAKRWIPPLPITASPGRAGGPFPLQENARRGPPAGLERGEEGRHVPARQRAEGLSVRPLEEP